VKATPGNQRAESPSRHIDPAQLRQAAQERLDAQAGHIPEDGPETMRLLHELQVHQIELEMQNDELQQARDSLSALMDRYTDLYDFAPVGYLTLGLRGNILQANLTAARMLGIERSCLLNSALANVLVEGSLKLFMAFLAERFAGAGTASSPDLACLPSPGRVSWIRLEASGAANHEECRVAVLDVSARKRAEDDRRRFEADLHHAQRLESLGSLSAGIAHDINNVLAAIYAVVETQSHKAAQDPDLLNALDLIARATKRGRNLVGGLTAFSRKDLLEPEPTDLNALVNQEVDLLQRSTFQMIEFSLDLEEPAPFVLAERNRLAAALMNLCVNAIDAMPDGGRLTLRTGRIPGAAVILTVEDSGLGMPPEVLHRAMDPFFTTKPFGKGTGLGLSTTYSTAKSHGGSLLIDSTPGKGTRVTLQLPEIPAERLAMPPEEQPSGHSSGAMSILLVDDDELIRASIPAMVESLGHHVESVASGEEALGWIACHPAVELVILDQNMPGMCGIETLRMLRMNLPQLPVLLATGNVDALPGSMLANDPWVRVIGKPFSLIELENAMGGFHRAG
jgi:PAS domain S-box-containing protein